MEPSENPSEIPSIQPTKAPSVTVEPSSGQILNGGCDSKFALCVKDIALPKTDRPTSSPSEMPSEMPSERSEADDLSTEAPSEDPGIKVGEDDDESRLAKIAAGVLAGVILGCCCVVKYLFGCCRRRRRRRDDEGDKTFVADADERSYHSQDTGNLGSDMPTPSNSFRESQMDTSGERDVDPRSEEEARNDHLMREAVRRAHQASDDYFRKHPPNPEWGEWDPNP